MLEVLALRGEAALAADAFRVALRVVPASGEVHRVASHRVYAFA
jgi:hypothetical protein